MPMKFRAHDTFFIRKGWLSKGMRCVFNNPVVFISRDENPMDVLGLGANMVKALRYWLQAVGLTEEPPRGRRMQQFTRLGEIIYQHDTYIEELGTLCLLQYCLASQEDEATAWYFFFNEFSMSEFSREDFVSALQKYIKMRDNETDYAIRSLNEDFQCIINTYVQRRGRVLRKFPGKRHAVIFDFITLPVPLKDVGDYDSDVIDSVKSLVVEEMSPKLLRGCWAYQSWIVQLSTSVIAPRKPQLLASCMEAWT